MPRILLLLLLAPLPALAEAPLPDFGEEGAAILAAPESGQALHYSSEKGKPGDVSADGFFADPYVHGVQSVSTVRGVDYAKALAAIFSDARSYHPLDSHLPEFWPHGFRLRKGSDLLEVVLNGTFLAVIGEKDGCRRRIAGAAITSEASLALFRLLDGAFPGAPDDLAGAKLGTYVCRLLREAGSIEAFRVAPRPTDEPGKEIQKHQILAWGKPLDREVVSDVRSLLFDGAIYKAEQANSFEPEIALRIVMDEEHLDVLISFKCRNLRIVSFDPKAPEPAVRLLPMGGARGGLLRLAKRAFPDDQEIAKLEE